MNQLCNLTATDLVEQLSSGQLSAAQCLDHFLGRVQQDRFNAFVSSSLDVAAELAREQLHQQIESTRSTLAGLPIAIKDGICTAGVTTTAGSRMLSDFVPPFDATCVQRLKRRGAIVVGKTNLDEFAMGSSTENSWFGPSLNPHNVDHVAGGSSGGSAAAVAAGLVPVALGSDTGGSIRQPASFCGITGLKPTYGRVSRYGLIAFASSLDQIGPMARTAADCALVMDAIAGHDPLDSTSAETPVTPFGSKLQEPLNGIRIGVCAEYFGDGLDAPVAATVRAAIEQLSQLGAEIVDVHLPHTRDAVATYYVIAPCEASSNLSRYDGVRFTYRGSDESLDEMYQRSRGEGFGDEVRRRILLGTYALSAGYYDAYYLQASKVRRLIKQDFDAAFEQVDLIVGPTTPTTAFKLGQHVADPLAMYLADVYTVGANLAGIPAISLPCGKVAGLPVGLQLQGKSFDESTLLQVAHQYQQVTDWHLPGEEVQ